MSNKFPALKNYKIIVPTLVVIFLLSVLMPRKGEFEYKYHKGEVWNYETLVAKFNFPILKTREQMEVEREKMGSSFIPYYMYMEEPLSDIKTAAEAVANGGNADFANAFVKVVAPLYDKGIIPEDNIGAASLDRTMSEDLLFIQRNKRAQKVSRTEVLSVGQVMKTVQAALAAQFPQYNTDSLLNETGLSSMILPNLYYDKKITATVHQRIADNISPTCGIFKAGSVIVSQGELITADIEQILDSYKAEYQETIGYRGPNYMLWVGNFLICTIIVFLLYSLITFSRPEIFNAPGQYYFILTLFALSNIVTFIFSRFDTYAFYLLPYPVFALYLMAFFRKRLVLPLYTLCLIPLLSSCDNGGKWFFIFLFAGFIAVFSFTFFNKGWRQFISAFFIFLSLVLSSFAVGLMFDGTSTMSYTGILYMFYGSLFAILAYPLIYLFEVMFNLVSVGKLSDLADTSNPLLRELSDKAPGTFQHSLSVMNFAEAVGRAVDADVYLLRAGALYHDIGKLANPQIFTENNLSAASDSDSGLSLKERAMAIIKHVNDGKEIAEKHNLPKVIRDFILTHHGTTTTGYFYNQYLNEGGDPNDAEDFTYPGPKPSTKEQVILMLCDSVEAASRSLRNFSAESVSKLVDDIYMSKYKTGQYDDSDITLHELELVKETLKTYLVQAHHGRIAYPKRKN